MTNKETSAAPPFPENWMPAEYEPGLLSIIVPTYNRAQYLRDAMDSAWLQGHRPLELIVVDDGSTDGTRDSVRDWDAVHGTDDRFRLRYIRQENAGAPAARNRGLRESRGEYIQFLDSDDALETEKSLRSIAGMKSNGADFVNCDCISYDETMMYRVEGHDFSAREHTPAAHVRDIVMNSGSPLFKREVLRATGPWNESLLLWQDFEYMFRVLAGGWRGNWIPNVLYKIRTTKGITKSAFERRHAESCCRACISVLETARRHQIDDALLETNVGKRLAWVAREAATRGDLEKAREIFEQARSLMHGKDKLRATCFGIGARVLGHERMFNLWLRRGEKAAKAGRRW